MRFALAALCLTLLAAGATAAAQEISEDMQRMVRDGMAEALDARLRGGRTPEEKHLLAQAYANKARRARDARDRRRSFEQADEKYRDWVASLERAARRGRTKEAVRLAAGRVEYAGMILSAQAANDLDEYEITNGERGDREFLLKLLDKAGAQYEDASKAIRPLIEDLRTYEEDLLAAGLYDTLIQSDLDVTLNLGWVNYYQGILAKQDDSHRAAHLAAAERRFQTLVNLGQTGQMRHLCHLALAMAQRELGRDCDALENFRRVDGDDLDPVMAARVRYERARLDLKVGRFKEARRTLQPLVDKDPQDLSPEDRAARFYINLAHIWHANSYLLEAEATRQEARDSRSRTAILQKARHSREVGLTKMNRLAKHGGPWPALVQIYVSKSVNLKTPIRLLSPMELLYTAGMLMDAKRPAEAAERLDAALQRENVDKTVAGDVLFELGRCRFQLRDQRGAAEAFATLAADYRSHQKAPQAATFAYQLWGQVAERDKRPEDYLRFVAVLQNLVESYVDHPNRDEALWLWPVALQLAREYEHAAERFAKVPEGTRHWEEAQFRRAMCQRQAVETARATLDADAYRTRIRAAARALVQYADAALQRANLAIKPDELRAWSAEARLAAAEALSGIGVEDYQGALDLVQSFEQQHPDSELIGRVLSIRIRAYRGLRDFAQASRILQQFLQTAGPTQIGPTLAALAKGMQQEVERLLDSGQAEVARKLAADSVGTFEELEKWVRAKPGRAGNLAFVLSGRARMHYLAGQYEPARQIVATLLKEAPKNGNYQHLRALILSAELTDNAPPAQLEAAQQAWAALLTDPGIRKHAPQRFWEARYNWLALTFRLGNAADVQKAISQERIWTPELGGEPWKSKLEALLAEAEAALGGSPETQPTPDADTKEPGA